MTTRTVAVFDLDGTLTRRDTYVALLFAALRRRPHRLARTLTLPPAWALHVAGFADRGALKTRALAAALGGLSREELDELTRPLAVEIVARGLRARARAMIEQHRSAGDFLVLATASLDVYVLDVARALGLHAVVCTESEWHEERLVPALKGGNCFGVVKRQRLTELLDKLPFEPELTVYTDSHVDLPILELAARPVAVNPTRKLAAIATARGYPIQDWDHP